MYLSIFKFEWLKINLISSKFIVMLFILYGIQGIPYGIQSRFLPVYLRSQSFSLTVLGLMKLLYIPWILKTLYAPMIDIFLNKITWLKISVFLLFLNSIFISFLNHDSTKLLIIGLFCLNLFSATQDISLDGIMIAKLTDSDLSIGNIAQVVGYKIGAIVGGGFLIYLSYYFNWHSIFMIISGFYFSGFLSIFLLSENIQYKSMDNHQFPFSYSKMFQTCLHSHGTITIATFVLIYKLGEQGAMNLFPLFLFDSGISLNEIGFWTGILGQLVSILGSSLAAFIIRFKGLWLTLYILSIISVPVHFIFILIISTFINDSAFHFYFSVVMVNSLLFLSGIRTTTAFSLMMKCSQSAPLSIQSTHYTFLATIEVLGKLLFSSFVGIFTDYFGYFYSYCLFFILSLLLLGYLLVFRDKILNIEQKCSQN